MYVKTIATTFLILLSVSVLAQQKYTISGYVKDKDTGENLIAANLFDVISNKGTVTNNYGFYSLTIPKGKVNFHASYVGFRDENITFQLKKDTIININLEYENLLDEVTILASKHSKIEKKTQMSQIQVQVKDIEKLPSLLGEVDVLKTLQLLPGVQGGTEGLNGIYVRGGSPDQNLVILDGVPVYNVSHLMGFLSVFNTDAIKNVTLTKGGFPARYGGRLSSVIEINMKDGNKHEYHGEGAIGILSSRLTFEGPLIKDKSSFIISGRRNYLDIIAKPLIKKAVKNSGEELDFKTYFYDLNAKINYELNPNQTLYASAYLGSDVFGLDLTEHYSNYDDGYTVEVSDDYYRMESGIDWGNIIAALRWNYQINSKLFANTTATYSKFNFNFLVEDEDFYEGNLDKYKATYKSGIYDWGGKIDFDYIPNPNHYIRFGLGNTYHTYNPGALALSGEYEDDNFEYIDNQKKLYSNEHQIYVEDDISLGAFKANIGIHASGFATGKKYYFYPQPRLGLRYLINNQWSLKASYSTMAQYINLLTNESLNLPTDLWVPSTETIKPQTSWQSALGAATTLQNGIEVSLETYYKKMNNVISYREGATFLSDEEPNQDWQNRITQGIGESYGTELLLQKKNGKTTGWLGYTLSWNQRQFDEINSGKSYPYKFDRRHDIELVVIHKLSERINLSGSWVYGTGNAVTLTEASYVNNYNIWEYDNDGDGFIDESYTDYENVNILGEKNSYRMAAYHRLDLGIEISKKTKWGKRVWSFGAYNTYNHRNPFFLYLGNDYSYNNETGESTDKKVYKQVNLLPIIPYFSYQFKF